MMHKFDSLLSDLVRQVLWEAYSPGLVQKLRQKFKTENPALTDDIIDFYIDKFDKNRDGPRIKGTGKSPDITAYSWHDLEALIDANFPTSNAGEVQIETDMKPVYESEDGTLQIFLGDRKEKCIALRQNFEGQSGRSYSWCISRSDASNMFNSYRFRANEPVFYYVFDTERPKKDVYHAIVIYINSEGEYFVANANNTGDKQMTWDQISRKMPKLKNLQRLFKHIPLTEKERKIYNAVKDPKSDEEFDSFTYDLKAAYVDFGHMLTDSQIRSLFKLDKGLVNKYCNMHKDLLLPLDIWKKLPPSTQKKVKDNFSDYTKELFEFWHEGKIDITGDLELRGTHITSLPPGLKVGRDLNLEGTPITSLPPDLKVGRDLNLEGTPITSLPPGLKVRRDLDLTSTPVTSLPPDLKVGGDLYLTGTPITSLPPDLKVGRDLNLTSTPITSLPPGLKVGRDLNLEGTPITSLPPDLKVGGDLWLSHTDITSLPSDLKIGGSLFLTSTPIASLPPGLKVGGSLVASRTPITSLPPGLKVGGFLYLHSAKITSLPPDLEVGGSLVASRTPITSLPRGLKVRGDLDLSGTKIASLPPDLEVHGKLIASDDLKLQYEKIKRARLQSTPKSEALIRQLVMTSISEILRRS